MSFFGVGYTKIWLCNLSATWPKILDLEIIRLYDILRFMLAVWHNIGKTMCKLAYFILNSMRQCFYHCVNTFGVEFNDG